MDALLEWELYVGGIMPSGALYCATLASGILKAGWIVSVVKRFWIFIIHETQPVALRIIIWA